MAYDRKAAEAYIRQSAAAKGLDPDIAVRVARSEGLANGVYQSNLSKGGRREPSYGPFQLLVGGAGTGYGRGLGNAFMEKTGLDPRDPSTVQQQIDFALDQAKAGGWSPWYGAAKVGVGKWDGIKGGTPSGKAPDVQIAVTGGGDATAYGGAASDTLGSNYGGLGGLGGLGGMQAEQPKVFGWRDAANAVADSLMTAPADEWWADTGKHLAAADIREERRIERQEVRDQRQADRQALQLALRSQGFTAEEASAYAASPQAARVAAAGKEAQQVQAQENQTLAWLRREHPDLADEVQAGLPITEGLRIASARRNATGETAEVTERRSIAEANGIDPNSEEGKRYILTGNLPAGDKGVTAGDRQAIREADDLSRDGESVYSLLDEALRLSPDAYEGALAGAKTWAGTNLPDGVVPDWFADPKTAENTKNYDNIITTQALGSLKSIFGGAPTEGERAILLEVQGMSSQPKNVREGIIRRAKDAVKRRVEFNRDRASELRGGTYYRPRDAAAPAPAVTPAPIVPGSDADPLGLR